ncbi:oxidoreductase C-terminal domain-containing protein [Streptomyces zhihengii]
MPYFWSEQFGRFVQYAGHHQAAGTPLWRGDPDADDGWSVLWLRDGALAALLTVDRPRDLAQGRRLLASGVRLDPDRAADPRCRSRPPRSEAAHGRRCPGRPGGVRGGGRGPGDRDRRIKSPLGGRRVPTVRPGWQACSRDRD